MPKTTYATIALASAIGLTVSARSQPAPAGLPPDPAGIARGQALYAQNCALCHGPTGRGGAEAADLSRSAIAATRDNGVQLGATVAQAFRPARPAPGSPKGLRYQSGPVTLQ
jgi:mono/diheme cytochrome c family protein